MGDDLSHRHPRSPRLVLPVLVGLVLAVLGPLTSANAVPTGWSSPATIDPPHRTPTSISCPSSTFCAEVDAVGNAFTYNGTTWSAAVRIDNTALGEQFPVRLNSVSCASASFCAAVDELGNATTYNGSTWSTPVNIDSQRLGSVSCSSATFCAAVDHFGYVMTYNGSSWSRPTLVDPGDAGGPRFVSCPSASFCAVMRSAGVVTYNGASWSSSTALGIGPIVYGISCASSTFCVAEGVSGFSGAAATTFNGSTWSTPSAAGAGLSVSCPSSSFCAAGDAFGGVATYNGTSWTAPTNIANSLVSVSCPSSTFCAASGVANPVPVGGNGHTVSDYGAVYTYDGATWSSPTAVDPGGGGPGSVSCPSTTFCAAVAPGMDGLVYRSGAWTFDSYIDNFNVETVAPAVSCVSATFCMAVNEAGDALTYNGNAWSAPDNIDGARGLTAVSCPAAAFCMAVSDAGDALAYNGSTWSLPTTIDADGNGLASVSCPTATFCVALDNSGKTLTYNGTTWTAPSTTIAAGSGGISCPTTTFCVAVSGGSAASYSGATWSSPVNIGGIAVSCATPTFCATVDSGGYAHIFNGSTWSAPNHVDIAAAISAISCPTASFCVATDIVGNAYTYGGAPPPPVLTPPAAVPVLTGGPLVSGTPRVGHTLTCHASYAGATSVVYHWKRNGVTVGAARAKYALKAVDRKTHIRCTAQAGNAAGLSEVSTSRTLTIRLGSPLVKHKAPSISGTAKVKSTVRAKVGTWTPKATSYSYQWLLGGKAIRHATHSSFTIPKQDKGKRLSLKVTAHRAGYANGSAISKTIKIT
ncbi:MAG: hypothetical protein QOI76_3240 [Frankiales bacterium]|nr:hypothetical protein [Frankiales bacterium]